MAASVTKTFTGMITDSRRCPCVAHDDTAFLGYDEYFTEMEKQCGLTGHLNPEGL